MTEKLKACFNFLGVFVLITSIGGD